MAEQSFFSIEIDKKTLDEVKTMLSAVKNGARDALRIAANKTDETARSRAVKKVNETVTLTQKRIREETKLKRANYTNLSSKVTISGKPIPLIEFKHGKQLKSGINITVRRGKKEKWAHVFVAQMSSGHTGIFGRREYYLSTRKRGNVLPHGYVSRLEIDEKFGPSTPLVFHFNGEDEVWEEAAILFQKKVLEQAIFLLNKAD